MGRGGLSPAYVKHLMANTGFAVTNSSHELVGRVELTQSGLRILSNKMSALHLLAMDLITKDEYKRIYEMIESPDKENLNLAEEIIKNKLNG